MEKLISFLLFVLLSISVLLVGCGNNAQTENSIPSQTEETPVHSGTSSSDPDPLSEAFQIRIENQSNVIIVELNDSAAARSLYDQLPITTTVEDFGDNEKIFYPPEKLDTSDAPQADGPAGTLAYYEPMGDVALFLTPCGPYPGLYGLGNVISGEEFMESLSGEITVAQYMDEDKTESSATIEEPNKEDGPMQMNIQVGGSTFTATLEENEAVDALVEMMGQEPVTIQMSDYSGFEKVGPLGQNLPTSNKQTTTQAGDIVLYQGNQIVMFYGSNSWSYTRLGHIDDLTGWEEALDSGDVTVTFSLED